MAVHRKSVAGYYKSHVCTRKPNIGSRGRKNGKAYHFHNVPKVERKPLDKCSVALWQIGNIELEKIFCKFDKPWQPLDPKTGQPTGPKVTGRWIIRHIVVLEHFRGAKVPFVVNKDSVRDMRDSDSMTHDEFIAYVQERTHKTLKIVMNDAGNAVKEIRILP